MYIRGCSHVKEREEILIVFTHTQKRFLLVVLVRVSVKTIVTRHVPLP